MNTLVLYFSKYGATKQYAEWLAESLHCETKDIRKMKKADLEGVERIIAGSSVMMGNLSGKKYWKKLFPLAKGKELALFSVSGEHGDKPAEARDFIALAFPEGLPEGTKTFALPGRLKFADLPPFLRWMFSNVAKNAKPGQETIQEFDFLKREHLGTMLSQLK